MELDFLKNSHRSHSISFRFDRLWTATEHQGVTDNERIVEVHQQQEDIDHVHEDCETKNVCEL